MGISPIDISWGMVIGRLRAGNICPGFCRHGGKNHDRLHGNAAAGRGEYRGAAITHEPTNRDSHATANHDARADSHGYAHPDSHTRPHHSLQQ